MSPSTSTDRRPPLRRGSGWRGAAGVVLCVVALGLPGRFLLAGLAAGAALLIHAGYTGRAAAEAEADKPERPAPAAPPPPPRSGPARTRIAAASLFADRGGPSPDAALLGLGHGIIDRWQQVKALLPETLDGAQVLGWLEARSGVPAGKIGFARKIRNEFAHPPAEGLTVSYPDAERALAILDQVLVGAAVRR